METKHIKKYFGLADFIDEQKFLEDQHLHEWKFKKISGFGHYTFEKVESEDYVYQLDYKEDDKDNDSYILLFVDCGWEYIMKYNNWYYFRKQRSLVNESDNEILSDRESKIDMIKKVMWRNLIVVGLLVLPINMSLTNLFNFKNKDIAFICIMAIYSLIFIALLSLYAKNIVKLNKLIHEVEKSQIK